MREDFDPVVADRFKVLDQAPVPDTWSRVQFELLDPTSARFTEQDAVNGTDYFAAPRARSTTVTLIDTEPTSTPTDGRRRWPIVAVAAAAVVATVVGALMLAARDDSGLQVPADTFVNNDTTIASDATTAASEVARAFVDAYAANDADRALAYLTDDVIAAGGLGRVGLDVVDSPESAEDFRRTLAWKAASGYKVTVKGCERSDGGTEADITVQCDYDVHALGSEAIGLGPFPAAFWLTVRGDKIVASRYDESPGGLFVEVWQPFGNWIRTEHPDDVPVMYTDASQNLYTAATTDEALRLWEQRTAEFVQAVLTGREAYPADVAAVCATQAARLGELTAPAEGALDQVATWNTAAAAILQQTRGELSAADKPMMTDTRAYSILYGQLILLARNFGAKAEAASAGDATRLAELNAEYLDLRQGMSSGPAGSGLEECLANLPS